MMVRSIFLTMMVILLTSIAAAHAAKADIRSQEASVVEEATGMHIAGAEPALEEPVNYNKPPLSVELPLFLFSLVLFGLFIIGMRSAVWQPLISGLNAREARVASAENQARMALREVEQLQARANAQLAETQARVQAIVSEARKEAEARKLEITAQAEREAQHLKTEALRSIEAARQQALAEIEQQVDAQVSLATQQVAGRRF